MILGYSIFVLAFNLTLYTALWLLYKYNFKYYSLPDEELPEVSILVAIRNEEQNIPGLLKGLKDMDYPKNKIQILIGDDGSEDSSLHLLRQSTCDQIQIVNIEKTVFGLSGKMNVLAQLAQLAKGKFLLYTDADMLLNSQWIAGMVSSINNNSGIIGGFTSIESSSTFHSLQNIDLHFGQGMLKVLNDIGYSVSVIGNNMLVDKARFDESGGYEAMDFSIVEDVSMLRRMSGYGSSTILSYNQSTHLITIGEKNWASLMIQRRRWFEGFRTTPVWLQLIMLFKFSFLPCLIYLSLNNPWFILGFMMKLVLSILFLREIGKSVNSNNSIYMVILFEFFEPILYYSNLICVLLVNKINWKGRKY